jgi:hypothetical protein
LLGKKTDESFWKLGAEEMNGTYERGNNRKEETTY